jgi:hypothetical protein
MEEEGAFDAKALAISQFTGILAVQAARCGHLERKSLLDIRL